MKLLWHYTVDKHVNDILRCGYIDVTQLHVYPPEKPMAWFSNDQQWERTVRKSIVTFGGELSPPWGLRQMWQHGVHGFRIGVLPESAPLNWTAARIQGTIPGKVVRRLLEVADKWGANPWDWYASLVPVHRHEWQAMEVWNGSEWTPFIYDKDRQEMTMKLRRDDRLATAPNVRQVCH
jgi:hypothetical protein